MNAATAKHSDRWPIKLIGQHGIRPWLQAQGSLTAKLKAEFSHFSVMPMRQQWANGHIDELKALGLPSGCQVWSREVCLMGDGIPRVFAHSVIARQGLSGIWRGLRHIGQRPLGEMLFQSPTIRRGRLHYRKLPSHHPLRKQVIAAGWASAHQPLWARRSLFTLGQQSLLVTEVFLPQCIS